MRAAARSACCAAGVGQMQAGGPAGQHLAGRVGLAVADEQDRRGGCGGRGRHRRDLNLLSGTVDRLDAALAARGRRLPPLPAPGRVARAGGDGEAGRVPRRDVLGPAGARVRRSRRPASSCSGWRRRPTAPTAPGACSPATAAGSGCSGRCIAPGSPTNRRRRTPATGCACATRG